MQGSIANDDSYASAPLAELGCWQIRHSELSGPDMLRRTFLWLAVDRQSYPFERSKLIGCVFNMQNAFHCIASKIKKLHVVSVFEQLVKQKRFSNKRSRRETYSLQIDAPLNGTIHRRKNHVVSIIEPIGLRIEDRRTTSIGGDRCRKRRTPNHKKWCEGAGRLADSLRLLIDFNRIDFASVRRQRLDAGSTGLLPNPVKMSSSFTALIASTA
jgi:hypothetical protein